MKVGSLFSGIGGFDLGLERAGYEIAWQVEIDEYCRKVLRKHWPAVPCHYDIKTIDWDFIPTVDLVCGGFPCQPFSVAGKRAGNTDDRYLWPEVLRCLDALRPAWFLGENVPGIINMALDQVCADLESIGYQVWPVCIPACAVDAAHLRQRVWIISHAEFDGRQARAERVRRTEGANISGRCAGPTLADDASEFDGGSDAGAGQRSVQQSGVGVIAGDVPDATRLMLDGRGEPGPGRRREFANKSRWLPEPAVGRVAHGVPNRVDRLKGLGNAIVPQIAEALGRMILEATP